MRKSAIISIPLALMVVFIVGSFAADEPWFDMPNCGFCKHLLTEPGLLENMTWEHHNISNGLVTITTVNDEYKDAYKKANLAMEETAKKMEKGESVRMCGSCMEYGNLMMAGVKIEHFETMHGHVTIMTSDKPELVAKIQAWGTRNTDEMKKMEQMGKEEK
jgi:hypothetical protein